MTGQNKKTRYPSNFHDNSAQGDVAFKICVALMVQALQGGGGGGGGLKKNNKK
jgi:hypothetical protein